MQHVMSQLQTPPHRTPYYQELSNLLNGLANLGHQPGDDVLSRVVLEAEAKLTDFSPQVCMN